ncbi:MAG: ABC transporter permease subunit [Dehalococcoidia bacterium]|jgi:ABC-2 type transport system permease protein
MRQTFIIVKRDLKEAFRTRSTYLYLVILLFISIPQLQGVNAALNGLKEQSLSAADLKLQSQVVLNVLVSTLPLIYSMLICSVISAYSITMDKAKRTLESLMATPLSLRQIWLGKSLAVMLPGAAIALFASFLAFLAINFITVVPTAGGFIFPSVLAIVTAFVIVPAMVFALVCLVSFLQLTIANARLANLAFVSLFVIIYFITIISPDSGWDFGFVYLAAIAVLAVVCIMLSRLLTKERVVLSSKS